MTLSRLAAYDKKGTQGFHASLSMKTSSATADDMGNVMPCSLDTPRFPEAIENTAKYETQHASHD